MSLTMPMSCGGKKSPARLVEPKVELRLVELLGTSGNSVELLATGRLSTSGLKSEKSWLQPQGCLMQADILIDGSVGGKAVVGAQWVSWRALYRISLVDVFTSMAWEERQASPFTVRRFPPGVAGAHTNRHQHRHGRLGINERDGKPEPIK